MAAYTIFRELEEKSCRKGPCLRFDKRYRSDRRRPRRIRTFFSNGLMACLPLPPGIKQKELWLSRDRFVEALLLAQRAGVFFASGDQSIGAAPGAFGAQPGGIE